MFGKFSEFWIKNPILTNLFIVVALLVGVFSWISVPKQYQPDIVQPVYAIIIPAPGYSPQEIADYAIVPFQKKMSEIIGIEHVSSTASRDYGIITVKFEGGVDNEVAFTRLTTKISNSLQNLPSWTQTPSVRSLDINDIPVFTLAIRDTGVKQDPENTVTLKRIANAIMKKTQSIPNVSAQYLVGGEDNNVQVFVNLEKLEARNVDLLQVYATIKGNNLRFVGGTFSKWGVDNVITINSGIREVADIGNTVVGRPNGMPVLLSDVAEIKRGIGRTTSFSLINTGSGSQNAVFIGIAKKKGSNSVNVIKEVQKELKSIRKDLPAGYEMTITQDEWKVAETETTRLLKELGNTVIVLFIVLAIFLGFQDAIGSALSVPIVLALVFGYAYMTGDNINQLTLFALILSLGMLVDNSIVVVENISRHLEWDHKGKTSFEIIIGAVQEIWSAVILSTVTKIISFIGLFSMTGVFGQYTRPIPTYIIISLLLSIFVSLSINPYISHLFEEWKAKQNKGKHHVHTEKEEGFVLRKYDAMLGWILSTKKRRITLKISFFVILALFLSFLPMEWAKTTSLPPSNDSQIYIWVDAPQNTLPEDSLKIAQDIEWYLGQYISDETVPVRKADDLKIFESVSAWIGMAPSMDNASLGRGGLTRIGKNQISIKIALIEGDKREAITSEYVLGLRHRMNAYVSKYPWLKVRYLLPPSGPASEASFIVKLSGEASDSPENVSKFADWMKQKIAPILEAHRIVDYYDSSKGYQNRYQVRLNNEYITRLGLSAEQVANSVYGIFNVVSTGLFHDTNSKEETHINVLVPDSEKNDPDILSKISFTNALGKRILLSEIATITPVKEEADIEFYDNLPTVQLFGDIQDWSADYPMKNLISRFKTAEFWGGGYDVVSVSDLECVVKEKATGKQYKILLDGTWKTSVETNSNLGGILAFALVLLYVIISANFQSFSAGAVLMLTFFLGFFGIMPWFALMYAFNGTYLSATSLIGIISIAGIVIGNGIIFLDYYLSLRKEWQDNQTALVNAGKTRMRPILLTSVTAIIGAAMIAEDPIWWGLAYVLIFGLAASALLMLIVIPTFLYDVYEKERFF